MGNHSEKRVANLLAAVDLMEFAVALMRQNISRRLPSAGGAVIEQELRRWLLEQPRTFTPRITGTGPDK